MGSHTIPLPDRRLRLAATALVFSILSGVGCSRSAPPAPSASFDFLTRIPDSYGIPYDGRTVFQVKEGALRLPSGAACGSSHTACSSVLAPFRGRALALEAERSSTLGDLSPALASLEELEPSNGNICLLAVDSRSRRCIPFHPLSSSRFSAWLDAEKPAGKLRVIMRSDGIEVVTDRGKVPGPDRFGPSIPPLGGRMDIVTLERTIDKLTARFPNEDEIALAPTALTSVEQVTTALVALARPPGRRALRTLLVYP